MNTFVKKPLPKFTLQEWIFLLPLYLICIGLAYYISLNIFQQNLNKEILFGISLSKQLTFNISLFTQLCVAISFIVVIHIISDFSDRCFELSRYLLAITLLIAIFLFVLGINLPLVKTTKFYFFKESYSLLEILSNLKSQKESFLYYIMLVFTFIVPLLKLTILAYKIFFTKLGKSKSSFLNLISKWAMVDVLVVANFITCIKSDNNFVLMASSQGLIYFVVSVLLSLLITTLIPYIKLR